MAAEGTAEFIDAPYQFAVLKGGGHHAADQMPERVRRYCWSISRAIPFSRIVTRRRHYRDRFVVISGCSSSGKSSLLAELSRRGYAFVEEPGRRIVKEELDLEGSVLPWMDAAAFARRCIALALSDLRAARRQKGRWVFDRSLIDASVALEHLTGEPTSEALRRSHRFHRGVFLAPPWPEIYVPDRERRHSLATALVEYSRLLETYSSLGYETVILPKASVAERADFILDTLRSNWPVCGSQIRPNRSP